VLGEHDKAVDAFEHAAKLKPDDPAILLGEAEALMPDHRPETPIPAPAVALFKRVETLDPSQPAALWYLGLASAQQRQFDDAGRYWKRLLVVLPPDSDQRQAVTAAIDALESKQH
jgi:cytochrome c-type biogenesis protein CcmH